MSNIIVLTGFACNGKTSMLSVIKVLLSSIFPDKKVIVVNEPVRYLMEKSRKIINNSPLNDRCFIDPFVFYYLNSPETVFVEKKNELLDLIGFLNVEFSFSYQFYYLNLPQKDEVIEKCFEDETRKNTIDIETIKEKDEKFYEKYCLFVGNRIPRYIHPSDNSYVVYKIVDEIIEKLR